MANAGQAASTMNVDHPKDQPAILGWRSCNGLGRRISTASRGEHGLLDVLMFSAALMFVNSVAPSVATGQTCTWQPGRVLQVQGALLSNPCLAVGNLGGVVAGRQGEALTVQKRHRVLR